MAGLPSRCWSRMAIPTGDHGRIHRSGGSGFDEPLPFRCSAFGVGPEDSPCPEPPDRAKPRRRPVTSLNSDPPGAVDPAQHIVSDEELSRLMAHDAEQRRRDHEESRRWLAGLTVAGALLSAFALIVSSYALARSTGTTTKTVVEPVAGVTRASATPAPLGHTVKASLTEMKIVDSVTKVAAGKVTFTVTNDGAATHEYVVL